MNSFLYGVLAALFVTWSAVAFVLLRTSDGVLWHLVGWSR